MSIRNLSAFVSPTLRLQVLSSTPGFPSSSVCWLVHLLNFLSTWHKFSHPGRGIPNLETLYTMGNATCALQKNEDWSSCGKQANKQSSPIGSAWVPHFIPSVMNCYMEEWDGINPLFLNGFLAMVLITAKESKLEQCSKDRTQVLIFTSHVLFPPSHLPTHVYMFLGHLELR